MFCTLSIKKHSRPAIKISKWENRGTSSYYKNEIEDNEKIVSMGKKQW